MKYYYEFEVKYQDVDANRKLRLYVLENYLLEVAGKCADELGFGIQYFFPKGLTWVLTKLSMEIAFLPTHCTHLVVETWIESNAHMLSTRDFRLFLKEADGSQRLFGKAIFLSYELGFSARFLSAKLHKIVDICKKNRNYFIDNQIFILSFSIDYLTLIDIYPNRTGMPPFLLCSRTEDGRHGG